MNSTGGLVVCLFVLLFPAVCQNDFQSVPAVSALNCSNITDFLEDSSALFQWYNETFTCDFTCEMPKYTTLIPLPTSPLHTEVETYPFTMTVTHRGETDMDCGMSCWKANLSVAEEVWTSPPEPTESFLTLNGITVESTPPLLATPPATKTPSQEQQTSLTGAPASSSTQYTQWSSFSHQSLTSDELFASPSPVISSIVFFDDDSSMTLHKTPPQGASETPAPWDSDSVAKSFSSPALMQSNAKQIAEETTIVMPPLPGMPDSYSIPLTGHPTVVEYFASLNPSTASTVSQAPSVEVTAVQEPTPTQEPTEVTPPTTDLEQLKRAAVVATFADINLQEWQGVEQAFKAMVAERASYYCSQHLAACGVSSRERRADNMVQFDPHHTIILPGYTRLVESGLEVVYSLLLPQGSGLLVDAAVLEMITVEGKDYIEQRVGKAMVNVRRFIYDASTIPPQLQDPVVLGAAVGAAVGAFTGGCIGAGVALLLFRMRRRIKKFWNRIRHRRNNKPADILFTDIRPAPSPEGPQETSTNTL